MFGFVCYLMQLFSGFKIAIIATPREVFLYNELQVLFNVVFLGLELKLCQNRLLYDGLYFNLFDNFKTDIIFLSK